ncbi:hypothetical protein [Leptospira kmetyi]|uniref:Pyridoxamine 5'-phosphate oxidase family protein n=1 Tax=Leptospira kmetyi TaxID=408139 RepID=A0A5F1Y0A9_9LEPT|nr:hypothetical protein [Leptospira kmetyi]AYV54225.1 hypothetical protein EFP84_01055 [Leptospira kmetyi]PJZ29327.1 hypothetical protein CH378_13455 [Leptospira kmetyi]TGK22568.1 hypothetical protein EHO62_01895 [Leptospira kmetyi]TGK27293.1 hypothetical protein EHO66_15385 [Leptospira kmetyi]TGL69146.1 hypothetical protein EHQ67_09930 [Leptospira kmetyi]
MITEEEMGNLLGPLSISIATRDGERRPHFARGFGVRLSEDQKRMTVLLPQVVASHCLQDIEDNRQIAATVAHMSSFQTRQFKGKVLQIENCTEEDYELMKSVREAGGETSTLFFGPKAGEGWRKYILRPALAITFELNELFDQSPGAKAGEKLK